MHPLLHRDKARSVESNARPAHNRGIRGFFTFGILCAIDVTGKIASGVILEAIDDRVQVEGG